MRKFARTTLPLVAVVTSVILGAATVLSAGGPTPVPEIDPTAGGAVVVLITGSVLIIRGRRKIHH